MPDLNLLKLLKRVTSNPSGEREPFDERLPDGTPAMQMGIPKWQRDQLQTPPQRQQQQSADPAAPVAINPALQRAGLGVPNGDAVALLKQQSPNQPEIQQQPQEPRPTAPVRVGTDTSGMSQIDRQQTLVDMMRNAAPGQKVRQHGDFIEEDAPEQSPSRVKNALAGLLMGVAKGGIGGGIGGLALGAVKPEAVQRMLQDQHVAREQNKLDDEIGTQAKRAKLEDLILSPQIALEKARRDAQYQQDRVKIQQDAEAGRITRAEADRLQRELDRKSREKIAAENRTSREKVAGMRGAGNPEKIAERDAKREAAQAEYHQLVSDEQKAGEEKNRAYEYLAKIKAAAVNGPTGDIDAQSRLDIQQATDAAQNADKIYQSFAEKKRDAQTRIKENSVRAANPPAPEGVTEASIRAEAKKRGQDEDAAVRKAKEFGWIQ